MAISARNHLKGEITDIKLGDVVAQITISVQAGAGESIITRQSVEEIGFGGRESDRGHDL